MSEQRPFKVSELRRSMQPLTEQEYVMEADLRLGNYSDTMDAINNFIYMREEFFTALEAEVLSGANNAGELMSPVDYSLEMTAFYYAHAFEDEEDFDAKVTSAAATLRSSLMELKEFIDGFQKPIRIRVRRQEVYERLLCERLGESFREDNLFILSSNFYRLHKNSVDRLLEHTRNENRRRFS